MTYYTANSQRETAISLPSGFVVCEVVVQKRDGLVACVPRDKASKLNTPMLAMDSHHNPRVLNTWVKAEKQEFKNFLSTINNPSLD